MLVIIDGHNLIGKMPAIQLDEARDEDKLLTEIRRYRARTGRKVILVFDAGKSYKPASKQNKGGITVQYAPYGVTADRVIINRLWKVRNAQQTLVVTSDREIQRVAKQVGAKIMDSADFAAELSELGTVSPSNDVKLSPAEVDEWLKLFGNREQKRDDK